MNLNSQMERRRKLVGLGKLGLPAEGLGNLTNVKLQIGKQALTLN
jgi:hypothetical protein